MSVSIDPSKNYSPLVVDSDAVIILQTTMQFFKPVLPGGTRKSLMLIAEFTCTNFLLPTCWMVGGNLFEFVPPKFQAFPYRQMKRSLNTGISQY